MDRRQEQRAEQVITYTRLVKAELRMIDDHLWLYKHFEISNDAETKIEIKKEKLGGQHGKKSKR